MGLRHIAPEAFPSRKATNHPVKTARAKPSGKPVRVAPRDPVVPGWTMAWQAMDLARFVHRVGDGASGLARFCHFATSTRVDPKTGRYGLKLDAHHLSPFALAKADASLRPQDVYFTPNRFAYPARGKRKVECTEASLVALVANYADLDIYRQGLGWEGVPVSDVVDAVLGHCDELGIPRPSLITFSGRGLLCLWLYPRCQPREALPRWRATQVTLNQAFEAFGADVSDCAPTKFYRLVGHVNAKSGRTVHVAWPMQAAEIERPSFDALDAAAGRIRRTKAEEKAAARPARAAREPRNRPAEPPVTKLKSSGYYSVVSDDLARLRAHRHPGGVVEDGAGRNGWCWLQTAVEAHLRPGGKALEAYVIEQAPGWGLSPAEALAKTSAVRGRASRAAKGEQGERRGEPVALRYRFRAETLIRYLRITPEEMEAAGLRVLVDDERRARLAAERSVKSRRARGVKSRTDQQAARHEAGLEALRLRDQERLTLKQIAERLSLGERTVSKAIKDARAAHAALKVKAAAEPAKEVPAVVPVAFEEPPPPAKPFVDKRQREIHQTMDAWFKANPEALAAMLAPEPDPAPPYTATLRARSENPGVQGLGTLVGHQDRAYTPSTTPDQIGTSALTSVATPAAAPARRASVYRLSGFSG